MTVHDLAEVYQEAGIQSPDVAFYLTQNGLRDLDVTPSFLLKFSKIRDIFTQEGKLKENVQNEIEKLHPKGVTIKDVFNALIEVHKAKYLN